MQQTGSEITFCILTKMAPSLARSAEQFPDSCFKKHSYTSWYTFLKNNLRSNASSWEKEGSDVALKTHVFVYWCLFFHIYMYIFYTRWSNLIIWMCINCNKPRPNWSMMLSLLASEKFPLDRIIDPLTSFIFYCTNFSGLYNKNTL